MSKKYQTSKSSNNSYKKLRSILNASTLSKLDTFSPEEKQNLLDSMKTVKEAQPVQAESVADSHTTFETTGKNIIDLDDSFVSDDKVASGVIQDEDIKFFDEKRSIKVML